jgi:hypothetical protein
MKVKIFALAAGLFAASGVAGYADTVSESNSYGPADTFWEAFILTVSKIARNSILSMGYGNA